MMLYKVLARTKRTDWVELNAFETQEEARKLVTEILNSDPGAEVMIENQEQAADFPHTR